MRALIGVLMLALGCSHGWTGSYKGDLTAQSYCDDMSSSTIVRPVAFDVKRSGAQVAVETTGFWGCTPLSANLSSKRAELRPKRCVYNTVPGSIAQGDILVRASVQDGYLELADNQLRVLAHYSQELESMEGKGSCQGLVTGTLLRQKP